MTNFIKDEIQTLYQSLIDAWNNRDAKGMAELFTEQGIQIGFDGSKLIGKKEIFSHLKPIFLDHPTAPFVTKVKQIRQIGADTALLLAIAGMVHPEKRY